LDALDDRLPSNFKNHRNCPSIYRLVDPAGASGYGSSPPGPTCPES
jgi:hypothetical protein